MRPRLNLERNAGELAQVLDLVQNICPTGAVLSDWTTRHWKDS